MTKHTVTQAKRKATMAAKKARLAADEDSDEPGEGNIEKENER